MSDTLKDGCFWQPLADGAVDLRCDPKAKLRKGDRVVVRLNGQFMMVGTLVNERYSDHRRALIRYFDTCGNEHVTRVFGRDKEVEISRVRYVRRWVDDDGVRCEAAAAAKEGQSQ